MFKKIINFLIEKFGIKRKVKNKKKSSTDDIYPMW